MAGNPSIIWMAAAGPLRFSPSATATMLTARPRRPGVRTAPQGPGGLGHGQGLAMTWAKLWYLRSNPELVSPGGPQAAYSPPKLPSWPGMSLVSAHAQRWPARLFTAGRRQLAGAGAHIVPSWMLRNIMVTSSMRPLRANKDRKRTGTAGPCRIPAVPPAIRPHRAHAARLPWLMTAR